jgi:hypothetical protein
LFGYCSIQVKELEMIHSHCEKDAHPRKTSRYCVEIILTILTFSILACSLGGGSKDFSGTWESAEWGTLEMKQDGSRVTGTYEYPSTIGQMYGQIEGELDGNRLSLKWWQSTTKGTSYAEALERGDAYFILAEDRNSITGKWRGEYQEEWAGDWNFTRK